MKRLITTAYVLSALALVLVAASCQKDVQASKVNGNGTASTTAALSASEAILAGSVVASSDTTKRDSVYMIGCYPGGGKADSVAFSSLPSAISTYLTANYAGYTFKKAYKAVTKSGTIDSYIVLITYDSNPVGIKFDVNGAFVAVLELMSPQDVGGKNGFHDGGPFGNRNGMHQDTVAISALPATIAAYFKTNYPADTLLHAVINPDNSYVIFSTDAGLYATLFTSKLVFVSHNKIMPPAGRPVAIAAANLPAAITTYLSTTSEN